MELVRVPSVVGRDAQLRKPLGAEKVVVLPARARHRARKPALPVHAKDERLAGCDRPRQRDRDERPVVGIAVVRRDSAQRRGQIGAVLEGDAVDLGKAPPDRLFHAHPSVAPSTAARLLGEPRGAVVLPRIQVEVEPEIFERESRAVREAHGFPARDAVLGIHLRLDRVGSDRGDARPRIGAGRGESGSDRREESGSEREPPRAEDRHERGC
jgi:hypothetical protein